MIFLEVSAKTAYNVEETFARTAEIIYDKILNGTIDPSNEVNKIIFDKYLEFWYQNWN